MDTKIIIVISAIAFVCCLLSFISLFIIKYQKRVISFNVEKEMMQSRFSKELLKSQIEVQESTFSTLGKELHDNIGQLLSTAKMLLGITERNIKNPPDTLITANETVGKAINELRSLSKSLSKEWLEQFDLVINLEAEVQRLNSAKDIKIMLKHSGMLTIKADEQIILFRIIQEAIQNAVKHSSANNVCISILAHESQLQIDIIDDGTGFDITKTAEGVGILNMKYRTKLLGGTIRWQSSSDGSIVVIKLPVKRDAQ